MIFSSILFTASLLSFFVFADKKLFFKFLSTCYLAMILGLTTDIITSYYPLWTYTSNNPLEKLLITFFDDFGVYFVVTYLFLQTIPKKETFISVTVHILYWSLLALVIEIIAHKIGWIKYDFWWNTLYSYISDWILYIVFYLHYKLSSKYSNF